MSSCVCKISSVQVCGGCCKMFRGLTFFGTQCIVIYPLSCIRILSTVISSRLYIHHLKTQQAFTWSKLLLIFCASAFAWGALTLLVGHQEEHSTCKIEWWGVGVVLCLERGADCLHMVQLMPLHPETPSPLASFKSRLVLPFWYQLSQVVLEKRLLDGCSVLVKVGDWAGQSIWYVSLHLTIENRTSRNFWCTNLILQMPLDHCFQHIPCQVSKCIHQTSWQRRLCRWWQTAE